MSARFFTPLGISACVFGLLALIGLVPDAIRSIKAGAWTPLPLGEFWASVDIGSLNLVQAVIQRYLHPDFWWAVVEPALHWPLWVPPLAIAAVLLVLKQRPWHTSA